MNHTAGAAVAWPHDIRSLLTGGDRRSIADSNRVRAMIEADSSLVTELAALTSDDNWLVAQRALDSLATLAERNAKLMPVVRRSLAEFEKSSSSALKARARQIRLRLAAGSAASPPARMWSSHGPRGRVS